jgi:serine protease
MAEPVPSVARSRRLTLAALLVALAGAGALAGPAEATEVPGEVLVRFRPGVSARERAAVMSDSGLAAARAFAPHARRLRIRNGHTIAATLRALRGRPEVATAAPNAIARVAGFLPRDPGAATAPAGWQAVQWNFLPGPAGVDAPTAWQHLIDAGRPGGRGVVVAVLDTGVAYAKRGRRFRRSPDFGRADFVRGYDFVDRDRFPDDENGHGTHVAGTIGERTGNAVGVTGLAYGARIMPVRVLDERGAGSAADITAGIRFAVRQGADVINLSFEFDDGIHPVTESQIPDVLAALRFARRRGVVVVAAAGNLARAAAAYPARYAAVIGVGATTEHGCHAAYSNTGPGVDLVAPGGGDDDAADPACPADLPAGRGVVQMTYSWATAPTPPRAVARFRRFGLPHGFAGTSMAAPHVSAAAALVIASGLLGLHADPAAVEARLKSTAGEVGVPGADPVYGAGRLDAGAATDPAR